MTTQIKLPKSLQSVLTKVVSWQIKFQKRSDFWNKYKVEAAKDKHRRFMKAIHNLQLFSMLNPNNAPRIAKRIQARFCKELRHPVAMAALSMAALPLLIVFCGLMIVLEKLNFSIAFWALAPEMFRQVAVFIFATMSSFVALYYIVDFVVLSAIKVGNFIRSRRSLEFYQLVEQRNLYQQSVILVDVLEKYESSLIVFEHLHNCPDQLIVNCLAKMRDSALVLNEMFQINQKSHTHSRSPLGDDQNQTNFFKQHVHFTDAYLCFLGSVGEEGRSENAELHRKSCLAITPHIFKEVIR